MRAPHVTQNDVGTLWVDERGDPWRIISYSAHPTVSWARVDKPDVQRGGVVGSPITEGFRRLTVEGE